MDSNNNHTSMDHRETNLTSRQVNQTYRLWSVNHPAENTARLCLFLDGEFYRERMATVDIVQQLVASNLIPAVNLLFVSHIDAAARHRDYTCCPDYTAFLVEELLPWATDEGISDGRDVLLAGLSLSGLAAAYAASRHPQLFPRALCQSPSAWWNDEWLASDIRTQSRIPSRFWISVGSAEIETNVRHPPTDMQQTASQRDSCQRLATTLSERSTTKLSVFEGGHDMTCWEQELPTALQWLYNE